MAYAVQLAVFEGPLDLLLHLIRQNKLDIYDIPIAEVTDQYLGYLALMESLDLEVAGDFLVMAATLTEIKSRMLLPRPPAAPAEEEEGQDPREALVQRLLEYERFKSAADQFRSLEEQRQRSYSRPLESEPEGEVPLAELTSADLIRAIERLLATSDGGMEAITSIQREKISLRLKMREILNRVEAATEIVPFHSLFEHSLTGRPVRLEVIVTFLAVLELLRLGRIRVRQVRPLTDIFLLRQEPSSP
jgi:segregation and condensation protein A